MTEQTKPTHDSRKLQTGDTTPKKPYATPVLTVHGPLQKVTLAAGTVATDGGIGSSAF